MLASTCRGRRNDIRRIRRAARIIADRRRVVMSARVVTRPTETPGMMLTWVHGVLWTAGVRIRSSHKVLARAGETRLRGRHRCQDVLGSEPSLSFGSWRACPCGAFGPDGTAFARNGACASRPPHGTDPSSWTAGGRNIALGTGGAGRVSSCARDASV
jgi:hypothetical protein